MANNFTSNIWDTFQTTYIENNGPYIFQQHHIQSSLSKDNSQEDIIKVSLEIGKKKISVEGNGNGPIDAFVNAVNKDLAMKIKVSDYHQHAISSGSDAKAVAYIEIQSKGNSFWGVGIHENTVIAGLKAVISGLNRIYSR